MFSSEAYRVRFGTRRRVRLLAFSAAGMALCGLIPAPGKAQTPSIRESKAMIARATLTVHLDQPTVTVSPSLYGIFFEEINQGGEGGLYAELLRTRGMEDGAADRLPSGWTAIGAGDGGTVAIDATSTPDPSRPRSLHIVRRGASAVGVANAGFWGVPVRRGAKYRYTLWYRSDVPVQTEIEGANGSHLAKAVAPATDGGWKRVELVLRSSGSDSAARLKIAPVAQGQTWLAFASLMPLNTWKGRNNGLRLDLAQHIDRIRPGFVRFPGGCYIEGNDLRQAFDWKATIGPVETRTPAQRSFWGYPSSNGLGYHEYLQWCEDLGARALFVVNCGMSHTEIAPMEKVGRYVQDALDAIEYALGPTTSKWGALRAQNGHAQPFNLTYVQIGNENGGPAYNERYAAIARAIKERYPTIKLVADVWGGTPTSYPLELIDEHYYSSPSFFWRNATRYDRYDRKGPKIYVGEYAVTQGSGAGNLGGALAEAAFMTGMERNSDVVQMSSYAPLFANVNNRQWNPNAIVFDSSRSYGTPSYWVQQLFSNHRADRVLRTKVQAPQTQANVARGAVGLQTWRTQAEFRNFKLEVDGVTAFDSSQPSIGQFDGLRGEWVNGDGSVRQNSLDTDRRALIKGVQLGGAKRVTYHLQARKLGGNEGFIIMMGVSPDHELQWNLGGWENTVHAFQIDGERIGRGVPSKIETGRWYDIRLERENGKVRGFLDGRLVEEIEDVSSPDFAAVVGTDDRRNEVVLKLVNGASQPRLVDLDFRGGVLADSAAGYVLKGDSLQAENSLQRPNAVVPKPIRVQLSSSKPSVTLPPFSLSILRIARRK